MHFQVLIQKESEDRENVFWTVKAFLKNYCCLLVSYEQPTTIYEQLKTGITHAIIIAFGRNSKGDTREREVCARIEWFEHMRIVTA